MSGNVFVIADLHFGHLKVALLRGFPDTQHHDDWLVKEWNRVVGRKDVVYVLGDVFRVDRVPELNGVKKLAPGNHDQRPMSVYLPLFSKIQSCFQYHECLLTHIPVHYSQFARWPLNIHGHTHARELDNRRYVAVSVEQCANMAPVPLENLIVCRLRELSEKAEKEANDAK